MCLGVRLRIETARPESKRSNAMETVFLKLGGSLLTDKRRAETPRVDIIARLAVEIAQARRERPGMRLILGHGSGSFGHVYGRRYGTREGAHTAEEWYGFAATADAAARLNRIVVKALLDAGIPAWSVQPSVALRCADGRIVAGPEGAVGAGLQKGLLPVVYGDVALDSERGATIASTEEIFEWLAVHFPPNRLVLAGEVDGIYTADPQIDPTARRIAEIRPATLAAIEAGLGESHGIDVTGGMVAKVRQVLGMVAAHPGLEAVVCSGLAPGAVWTSLADPTLASGTRILA